MADTLSLLVAQRKQTKKWKQKVLSWEAFVKILTKKPEGKFAQIKKENAPMYAPVTLRQDAPEHLPGYYRRLKANVGAVTALVYDYDKLDPEDLETLWAYWSQWRSCLHTSYSSTPEAPRVRVVVCLAQPIPSEYWTVFWNSAKKEVTDYLGIEADTQCTDTSRCYAFPALPYPSSHFVSQVSDSDNIFNAEPHLDRAKAILKARADKDDTLRRRARDRWGKGKNHPQTQLDLDPILREAVLEDYTSPGQSVARRMPCPGCHRDTLWAPLKGGNAWCNHKRSCGWFGPLSTLPLPSIIQLLELT